MNKLEARITTKQAEEKGVKGAEDAITLAIKEHYLYGTQFQSIKAEQSELGWLVILQFEYRGSDDK